MATTTPRVVAYYRLDRREGRRARAALAEREQVVAKWLRKSRKTLLESFVEVPAGAARPDLDLALERCRSARATLLVPCLAEVGGDLPFLEAVSNAGVSLAAVDSPRLPRATVRLLLDVARYARSSAGERVREGLAGARRRGARLGSPRPEIGARRAATLAKARAEERAAVVAPWIAEVQLGNPGCSLRQIAIALEALGIPTPRGGRWGPSTVRSVIEREAGASRSGQA
jgi:DNA invertase Pin-like site-specific DNA recombinase